MPSEPALPSDYDAGDGFDSDSGLDVCPHCEQVFSMNGGIIGPAFDTSGRRYETILDSDPGDRPFFCESCWSELDANRKAAENRGLEEFTEGSA